jgi:acyl carrier protein
VLSAVRSVAAGVLGHDSPEAIDPQATFKDLGFDSLAAVELYNYLCQTTGLQLPTTLGFDHPTPVALAQFLRAQMDGDQDGHATVVSTVDADAALDGNGMYRFPRRVAADLVAGSDLPVSTGS